MKSIMSCSSLSSIMRSLGLLLRVSTINWCRSMPVESVYSTLDSESDTGTGRMCYKTTNTIRNYTAILNTPGEPHVNSGTESNFITFYLLPSFLSFMRYFRKHTHTFGQWRFLWICAALLLLFLFTGSSPVVMAARWDVCVWRCLKKKERISWVWWWWWWGEGGLLCVYVCYLGFFKWWAVLTDSFSTH